MTVPQSAVCFLHAERKEQEESEKAENGSKREKRGVLVVVVACKPKP